MWMRFDGLPSAGRGTGSCMPTQRCARRPIPGPPSMRASAARRAWSSFACDLRLLRRLFPFVKMLLNQLVGCSPESPVFGYAVSSTGNRLAALPSPLQERFRTRSRQSGAPSIERVLHHEARQALYRSPALHRSTSPRTCTPGSVPSTRPSGGRTATGACEVR